MIYLIIILAYFALLLLVGQFIKAGKGNPNIRRSYE